MILGAKRLLADIVAAAKVPKKIFFYILYATHMNLYHSSIRQRELSLTHRQRKILSDLSGANSFISDIVHTLWDTNSISLTVKYDIILP